MPPGGIVVKVVGTNGPEVERALVGGELACPVCGDRLPSEHRLLRVDKEPKKAPLATSGYTAVNRYTLCTPFGSRNLLP